MALDDVIDTVSHLGGQMLPTFPPRWGVNRHFQAKLAKTLFQHNLKKTVQMFTKFGE